MTDFETGKITNPTIAEKMAIFALMSGGQKSAFYFMNTCSNLLKLAEHFGIDTSNIHKSLGRKYKSTIFNRIYGKLDLELTYEEK